MQLPQGAKFARDIRCSIPRSGLRRLPASQAFVPGLATAREHTAQGSRIPTQSSARPPGRPQISPRARARQALAADIHRQP
jgi:hypothetical protein